MRANGSQSRLYGAAYGFCTTHTLRLVERDLEIAPTIYFMLGSSTGALLCSSVICSRQRRQGLPWRRPACARRLRFKYEAECPPPNEAGGMVRIEHDQSRSISPGGHIPRSAELDFDHPLVAPFEDVGLLGAVHVHRIAALFRREPQHRSGDGAGIDWLAIGEHLQGNLIIAAEIRTLDCYAGAGHDSSSYVGDAKPNFCCGTLIGFPMVSTWSLVSSLTISRRGLPLPA